MGLHKLMWTSGTARKHNATVQIRRRARRAIIDSCEPRYLLSGYVPDQVAPIGTYNGRVDVTWTQDLTADLQQYKVRYRLASQPLDPWIEQWLAPLDSTVSLLPAGDVYGEATSQSVSASSVAASIRGAAVTGLTASTSYVLEVGAVTSTTTEWSAPTTVLTPTGRLEPDVNTGELSLEPRIGPSAINIHASEVYTNLFMRRQDNTTGQITLLPIDHGAFEDVRDTQDGSLYPAYVDAGIDLTHAYTYSVARQAGVPTLSSYWKIISNTNGQSYQPQPSVQLHDVQESTLGGQRALHITWIGGTLPVPWQNGYVLEWSDDNGTNYYPITDPSEAPQVSGSLDARHQDWFFTGAPGHSLDPGKTFQFRLMAVAGNTAHPLLGSWQDSLPIQIGATVQPTEAPEMLNSVSIQAGVISVGWKNIPDQAWGGFNGTRLVAVDMMTAAGTVIERRWVVPGPALGTQSAFFAVPLAGETYSFRAFAVNRLTDTTGAESTASATITRIAKPHPVGFGSVDAFGTNLIRLEWHKSPDPSIQYELQRRTDYTDWDPVFPDPSQPGQLYFPAQQTSYNGMNVTGYGEYLFDDTTVNEGTRYYYQIRAVVVQDGTVVAASGFSQLDGRDAMPAPATDLRISRTSPGGPITLTWNIPYPANAFGVRIEYATETTAIAGGPNKRGFAVLEEYALSDHWDWIEQFVFDSSHDAFDPAKDYTFRVFLTTDAGRSQPTNLVSTVAPPDPQHITATPIAAGAVQITWDYQANLVDKFADRIEEGFRVLNEDGSIVSWYAADTGTLLGTKYVPANYTGTIIEDPALVSGKQYTFKVWAYNTDWLASSPTERRSNAPATTDAPVQMPANDSFNSYRIRQPYLYIKDAGSPHYAGPFSVDRSGWAQYESAAWALATGVSGQYRVKDGADTLAFDLASSAVAADYGPTEGWDYIAFAEDSLARIERGEVPARNDAGENNGWLRLPVDVRSTVSVKSGGYDTTRDANGVIQSCYALYTLRRSGDPADPLNLSALRVRYQLSGSGAYGLPGGEVVFAPGQTTATLRIPIDPLHFALRLDLVAPDESNGITAPYVVGFASFVTRHPGDVNGDGAINAQDTSPYIYALVNGQAAFEAQFPSGIFDNADCSFDNLVNAQDTSPYVYLLTHT